MRQLVCQKTLLIAVRQTSHVQKSFANCTLRVSLREGTSDVYWALKHETDLNEDLKTVSEQQKKCIVLCSENSKDPISISFPTFYYSLLRFVGRVSEVYFCVVCSLWPFIHRFPWTLQAHAEHQV